MNIEIRYFAVVRERLGRKSETLLVPVGSTSSDVMELLTNKYPEIARLKQSIRLAVNQNMISERTELFDGDEVALIPPVAGG